MTAPIIQILGADTVEVVVGESYVDAGATAVDDSDGDITALIVVTDTVDTSVAGMYSVTYTVTDAAGNAANEVVRTVTVVESVAEEVASTTPVNTI